MLEAYTLSLILMMFYFSSFSLSKLWSTYFLLTYILVHDRTLDIILIPLFLSYFTNIPIAASLKHIWDFTHGTVDKNLLANVGDMGFVPGLGRFHMPWSN